MTDFADSHHFYQTLLGRETQDNLRSAIGRLCPCFFDGRVLPLGCADLLLGSATTVSGRMTTTMGETFSCLVDSKNKPLPDADIDCVVALHAAKEISDMDFLLREIWRVLKGEGRLLLIVPRRRSAWAENLDTPFGKEQAYSVPQIKKILRTQGFSVARVRSALYAPPGKPDAPLPFSYGIEKVAPFVPFCHGGVLIISAHKRICGLAGAKKWGARECADPLLPSPLPI